MAPDWIDRWSTYLSADASAAATLTGLVFVAISINLSRVVASPGVSRRAAESVIQLMGAFVVSTTLLIPGQSPHLAGTELLFIGLLLWITQVTLLIRSLPGRVGYSWYRFFVRTVLSQLATVPFLIAGLALVFSSPGGLSWLALGLLFSFIAGVIGAWVLLIEIIR